MSRPGSRTALIAAAVLIAALAVRIAQVQLTSYRPINDAGSYLTLASEIAQTGGYSTSHRAGAGAGGTRGPTAYFAPGYPYFLAGVDLLDGHAVARGAVRPARLAQAVLGTLVVALIGLVALEAFGATIALIAALLAAAYPVLVELSGTLVAENLMTVLVLAALWATLRARRSRAHRLAWIGAAGVLVGLATLTHENAALIAIPLAFAVGNRTTPRRSLRALAAPALMIGAAVLTIAPWTIRNALLLHRLIPVSDEAGITLVGTYNSASAANPRVPYKWRLYYSIPADGGLVRRAGGLPESELESRLLNQAWTYVRKHPLAPLAVAYHNTRRLLEIEGKFAWRASAAAIGLPRSVAAVGVVSFWIMCALALAGALTRKARRAPRWLWAIPLLLVLSVVFVNAETPRFREPIDPFVILLAACGVAAATGLAFSERSAAVLAGLRGPPVPTEGGAAGLPAELVEVQQRLPGPERDTS